MSAIWSPTDRVTVSSTVLFVGEWADIDRETFARVTQPGFTVVNVAANYVVNNATPFAAFAAAAPLTMNRRDAMVLVGLVWLANQGVGFGVLHYPLDCFAWGVGLGIVALLSELGAEFGAKRFIARNGILASTVAFLSAFGVYEILLFIASMIFQSGVADYAPAIVGRIFAINAVAFIGLLVVNRLGVSAGLVLEPRRQLVATGRRS